jgi:hypothetical protein
MEKHFAVWRIVATASQFDDSFLLGGVCPWDHEWKSLGNQLVNLPNISFPDQLYEREIYRIQAGGLEVEFCAVEGPAYVWQFWAHFP